MTMQLNSYQTLNPTIPGSGGYCFGLMMYFDAMHLRWMAEYMAEDIIARTDNTSPNYVDPEQLRWPKYFELNPWWQQVLFLHALTLQHKQTPILGWTEESFRGSIERKVARALYYAKWWKEKHCECEQKEHGKHWGTATGFFKFDPTEFLDPKWADCFTRSQALTLEEA